MRRFIQVTDKLRRMWDSEHFPFSLSKDLNMCMTNPTAPAQQSAGHVLAGVTTSRLPEHT